MILADTETDLFTCSILLFGKFGKCSKTKIGQVVFNILVYTKHFQVSFGYVFRLKIIVAFIKVICLFVL